MTVFMEQALIFIGAAIVLVPLFSRLGFGSVLGYLIAGVVVGPFGLKLIHEPDSIMRISEFGVILLLFMIGLEIQPRRLWSMRRHLIWLGGTQIVLTSAVFMAAARLFGLSPLASAVVGFAFSLSSTAFAVQTLTERGQFNTEPGRATFAILLAQDLFAIPALGVIPALGNGNAAAGVAWPTLGLAVLLIGALIVASRFLMRPAFRLIAATHSREIFMASALFVVLGVSALMEAVGLSAALGAFLAGVFLADSEYRHELEANLEPFKSLFMGLFFIAVGMAVRIDLIWREPATVFLLAFAYLAVKMALIYLVGRSSRLTKASAGFMAVSIAQGGEFAFVIFGLAAQLHLAAPDTLALLVAVISLSMVLSPLIGLGNERFLRRRRNAITPQYDQIEGETARVIIAGFGRFGQIFGRILRAQDIAFVAIDQDPDQVELIRRFGYKVYYGDVSRFEILQAAGAGKASYLILALDDVDTANRTVHLAQEHFPHLTIFARARNRGHAFDLMEMGVTAIKRELFDSSVSFVGDLLVKMGFPPAKAALIIDKFKRHDEIMLREQFKVRGDDKVFVSVSRQGAEQLANVLREEGTQSYIDGV